MYKNERAIANVIGKYPTFVRAPMIRCNDKCMDDMKSLGYHVVDWQFDSEDWKEEKPANRMRLMQFRLSKKGDDKEDAELVLFKGLGGGSEANVKRWKDSFVPPEGKKIDDVAEVKEIKIGGVSAVWPAPPVEPAPSRVPPSS